MAYSLNLHKLISDLRGPKGLAALTEEVTKLKAEVDRIRDSVQPEAKKRLKKIQVQLNKLKNDWDKKQVKFEAEVTKTVKGLKKAAQDAEAKLEKAVKTAANKASKASGRTSKKVSKVRTAKKKTAAKKKTSKKK